MFGHEQGGASVIMLIDSLPNPSGPLQKPLLATVDQRLRRSGTGGHGEWGHALNPPCHLTSMSHGSSSSHKPSWYTFYDIRSRNWAEKDKVLKDI